MVRCQSKSQGIQYRLGLIVYDIVAVKIFEQYCNIALLDSSPRCHHSLPLKKWCRNYLVIHGKIRVFINVDLCQQNFAVLARHQRLQPWNQHLAWTTPTTHTQL